MEKISYERRVYKSVDHKSLSCFYLKNRSKIKFMKQRVNKCTVPCFKRGTVPMASFNGEITKNSEFLPLVETLSRELMTLRLRAQISIIIMLADCVGNSFIRKGLSIRHPKVIHRNYKPLIF